MVAVIQLRDEVFLPRNVAFRLPDMPPSHRQAEILSTRRSLPPLIHLGSDRRTARWAAAHSCA